MTFYNQFDVIHTKLFYFCDEACGDHAYASEEIKVFVIGAVYDAINQKVVDNVMTLNVAESRTIESGIHSCTVEVLQFERSKTLRSQSRSDRFSVASTIKTIAVDQFKNNKLLESCGNFSLALKLLIAFDALHTDPDNTEETNCEMNEWCLMKVNLHANLAACQLKNRNFVSAIENCNDVLELDELHEKARYRRACAYIGIGRFDDAIFDLNYILNNNPNNKLTMVKLAEVDELKKADKSTEVMKCNLMKIFK